MAAALLDEAMVRGNQHRFRIEVYNERTGVLTDISGWTNFWSTVKAAKTDTDPGLLQLTLVSGIAVISAASGLLEVTIPDTAFSGTGYQGVTNHFYMDVKGKDASGVHWMLASGRLRVEGDVTRSG